MNLVLEERKFSSQSFLYFSIVTLFLVIILCLWQQRKKKNQFKNLTSQLQTDYGFPLVGIGYKFISKNRFLYVFGELFAKLESFTFFTWLGLNPFLITADPDNIQKILASEEFLVKARSIYTSIDNALPNGIMTSNGSKWRHDRKLMNHFFGRKVLTNLVPIFNKNSKKAIEKLRRLANGEEHNIFSLLKTNILQTALETTMGIDVHEDNEEHKKIADSFNFILQEVAREMVLNAFHLGWLVHTPKYNRTLKFLRDCASYLIENKYKDLTQKPVKDAKSIEAGDVAGAEIFIKQALMYHQLGHFDLSDVISQTHTMIAGSFDTVSTTIFSIIALLAMHPDVQEKLYSEVVAILKSKDAGIEYEQTKEIPYMDMVIDETLRLMPSIPVIGRETDRDFQLSSSVILPKGMQVMIPIFTLHRRKDIWGSNANDFNPDNFLPENIEKRHPYAYIPFSKGPRNCIGLRYAHVALRVLLLDLIRNFKFSTSFQYENLVLLNNLSLRYEQEPKIKIELRH